MAFRITQRALLELVRGTRRIGYMARALQGHACVGQRVQWYSTREAVWNTTHYALL